MSARILEFPPTPGAGAVARAKPRKPRKGPDYRTFVAPKHERGVYWALGTKGGRAQLFAIDSKGDEIRRIVLKNDQWAYAEAAIASLWNYLDSVDPRPLLRLAT